MLAHSIGLGSLHNTGIAIATLNLSLMDQQKFLV